MVRSLHRFVKRVPWVAAACLVVLGWAGPILPKPSGYVSDLAGVLSLEARIGLERTLTELEERTSSEVAVVTIQSLEGDSLERYAQDLFQSWGIGKKGKNNGVLMLVALEDRKVRIQTGYGVEAILPDGLCGEIIRTRMVPRFRGGDFAGGIVDGIGAVASVIRRDPDAPKIPDGRTRKRGGAGGTLRSFFFLFALVMIILAGMSQGGGGRGGRGGSTLPFWLLLLMSSGRSRGGGFSGGGFRGGGFGGFGGGFSGGGGASGGW